MDLIRTGGRSIGEIDLQAYQIRVVKNSPDLSKKKMDSIIFVKSLDIQTSDEYYFKIALQGLKQSKAYISQSYPRKWNS
jgi:hypothetical protein